MSSPKFAHGLHAEVEELVPGVVVGVVLVTVVAGGESLGGRGRGVARVDGTGSPPAPPPAAAPDV